ncbi:MAG: DUF2281 domain-containing protein [Sphingobacteriales bacterium]|nr:DUF2281 domain-containing protein [Sphingobacteriales bacterium]
MTSLSLYTKLETLPTELKKEAKDFIEALLEKNEPKNNSMYRKPVFGSLKGKITLSEDFDAPLEEFNDYM